MNVRRLAKVRDDRNCIHEVERRRQDPSGQRVDFLSVDHQFRRREIEIGRHPRSCHGRANERAKALVEQPVILLEQFVRMLICAARAPLLHKRGGRPEILPSSRCWRQPSGVESLPAKKIFQNPTNPPNLKPEPDRESTSDASCPTCP
jgi:hypothetical protein